MMVVWNGIGLSPQEMVVCSESWLQEFQKWHKPVSKKGPPVVLCGGISPVLAGLNAIFDGGLVFKNELRGGFGVVMRDHEGGLIAAAAGSSGRISSAFEAELVAARQAVLFGPRVLSK